MKNRKFYFRSLAILLGLSVFPLFEVTCRLAGWGAEVQSDDAFAEFAGTRPLFSRSPDGTDYTVAKDRRLYFAEESFPAVKAPNVFRIFVFGGSTVQGRPFSIPTSFGTFLRIGLTHADPSKEWQVVNCGGISYASYRLIPIVEECLNYQPDMFIVCTGHNEFLECVTYSEVITASSTLRQGRRLFDHSHGFRLMRQFFVSSPTDVADRKLSPQTIMSAEVDALLDHHGGLSAFTRSSLHSDDIVTQFGRNLQQIVDTARSANVPVVVLSPPSNLRDCPPFKSEYSAATTPAVRQRIAEQLKSASDLLKKDPSGSAELLRATAELDSGFAFTWYQLGHSHLVTGSPNEAKNAFVRARDEDICPLRMTSALQQAMLQVVTENQLPYLDLQSLMEKQSRQGLVGDAVLVDHIHPSFRSHQQIALSLIDKLGELLHLRTIEGWELAAQQNFDSHLQSLPDMYFLRGRQTLQNLRAWSQGRGDGPPLTNLPSVNHGEQPE